MVLCLQRKEKSMISPVIIKFKKAPELGRLRVVKSSFNTCVGCALDESKVSCAQMDRPRNFEGCVDGKYHYEKVSDK